MGRGEIISGGDGGRYLVRLLYATERIEADLSAMAGRIVDLSAQIAAEPEGDRKNLMRLSLATLQKSRAALYSQSLLMARTASAWCADRSENLSGEVALVEFPGFRSEVQIRPGYEDGAAWAEADHGRVNRPFNLSAASAVLHMALLPGWEKWFPTYRHATILAIDRAANTADLLLSQSKSLAQGLDVNQAGHLLRVPVSYMSCNAGAFSLGDEVLVEFVDQDWSAPRVIGFRKEPRACGFVLHLTRGDGTPADSDMASVNVQVYDADANPLDVTKTWDADLGAWLVTLDNQADYELGRYWVRYSCTAGLTTQYPLRYKTADQWDAADLVEMGVLSDTIPYWSVSLEWVEDVPEYSGAETDIRCDALANYNPLATDKLWVKTGAEIQASTLFMNLAAVMTRRLTVRSSVPYRVGWGVLAAGEDQNWRWLWDQNCDGTVSPSCSGASGGMIEWSGWGGTVVTDGEVPGSLVDTLNSSDFAANIPGGAHDLVATEVTAPTTDTIDCPWPNEGTTIYGDFVRSSVERAVFSLAAYWNI